MTKTNAMTLDPSLNVTLSDDLHELWKWFRERMPEGGVSEYLKNPTIHCPPLGLSIKYPFNFKWVLCMEYVAFGDESGTTGSDRCYGIGLLCVRKDTLHIFNERVQKLKDKYGIVGELKWSKIKNSAGQANICIELLAMVLKNSCCFHSIIVVKNMYNNWQTDRELAFYQTYTMLVKNVAKQIKNEVEVIIDQKIDKYKKNDEVTGIVANNMLARAGMKKLVKSVTMHDSKHHLGLQVVDILTGAVNSGYLKYLNPRLELSVAKELAFERMAALLGWDVFHYDTFPNKDFNIWHFPQEMRAMPGSKSIRPDYSVPLVQREELA